LQDLLKRGPKFGQFLSNLSARFVAAIFIAFARFVAFAMIPAL